MPRARHKDRAGPIATATDTELVTPSHSPVRKIAGRRSRSPSPKRRPLSRGTPGLQLGNFDKLFAALSQTNKAEQPTTSTRDTTTASSQGTTPTLTSQATLSADTSANSITAELNGRLHDLDITPTPSRGVRGIRKLHLLNHRRDSSGSSAQTPLSPSRNIFAALQSTEVLSGDPEALLTPPASDDEEVDTVFEQTKSSSPPSAATTPCPSSEEKSDCALKLGSRIAALVGLAPLSFQSTPVASRVTASATASTQLPLTPIPLEVTPTSRPVPSSENAQRLFDLHTTPAKPTASLSKFMKQVHNVFSPYDQRLEDLYSSQLADGTHIFVDWSNFFVGCRSTVRDRRNMGPREKLRFSLNFERVKYLLERKRTIRSRHLAGSRGRHKFANDQLDAIALKGYEVMCPQRIPTALHRGWSDYDSYTSDCSASDSDHSRRAVWDKANSWDEQCVDELLQLKMAKEIIQSSTSKRSGVMVLATGDANDAEFSKGGFFGMVTNALESGWCVELHSFSSSISSAWRDPVFAARWGDQFTYHILDDFAEYLVEQDV